MEENIRKASKCVVRARLRSGGVAGGGDCEQPKSVSASDKSAAAGAERQFELFESLRLGCACASATKAHCVTFPPHFNLTSLLVH